MHIYHVDVQGLEDKRDELYTWEEDEDGTLPAGPRGHDVSEEVQYELSVNLIQT